MPSFRRSALLACLPALGPSLACPARAGETAAHPIGATGLQPIEAKSAVLGPTHLLATYVVAERRCAITAMIEERVGDEPSVSPARTRFDLELGSRALVENAGGAGAPLVCGEDTEILHVEPNTRLLVIASRPAS